MRRLPLLTAGLALGALAAPAAALPGGQGQLTTRAGFAQFRSARIAPDGRFVASATRSGSAVLVRG